MVCLNKFQKSLTNMKSTNIKRFSTLHSRLTEHLQTCIAVGKVSTWWQWKTTLIQKSPEKDAEKTGKWRRTNFWLTRKVFFVAWFYYTGENRQGTAANFAIAPVKIFCWIYWFLENFYRKVFKNFSVIVFPCSCKVKG